MSFTLSATSRPTKSVGPPGGKAITTWIGLFGKVLRLHGGRGRREQQQRGGKLGEGVTALKILPSCFAAA